MAENDQEQEIDDENNKAEFDSQKIDKKRRLMNKTKGLAGKVKGKLEQKMAEGSDKTVLVIGLSLAIMKDFGADIFLDFFLIGEIPIIGQIPGMFISGGLAYFMQSKSPYLRSKILKKFVFPFILDCAPLINNIPITVATVILAWMDLKKRAEKARADKAALESKTQEELSALDAEE